MDRIFCFCLVCRSWRMLLSSLMVLWDEFWAHIYSYPVLSIYLACFLTKLGKLHFIANLTFCCFCTKHFPTRRMSRAYGYLVNLYNSPKLISNLVLQASRISMNCYELCEQNHYILRYLSDRFDFG